MQKLKSKFSLNIFIPLLLNLLFSTCTVLNAEKVLILTHVHSRPDFIEVQDKTFKAFLKDDYKFVVFNDAPTPQLEKAMVETCNKLGIECIRVPQEKHIGQNTPADRHGVGIQLSLDKYGYDHDGIVFLIDSDMFLVKPLSIIDYVKQYDLVGLHQERTQNNKTVTYLWPGLLFINMKTAPNKKTICLNPGSVDGVSIDTGGHLYEYLVANPSLKIKKFEATSSYWLPNNHSKLKEMGFDDITSNFIIKMKEKDKSFTVEFHCEGNFVHYYAGGSNWINASDSFHRQKTDLLNNFITKLLKQANS